MPDFERGDLLQLQGRVEIDWTAGRADWPEGTERLWRFHVARGWRRPAAVPLRWSFVEVSPATERTGAWKS